MKWVDVTSYRKGDKLPKTFAAKCGVLRLVVTKCHILYPDDFVAHAHPLFDTKKLEAKDFESAKRELVDLVRDEVKGIIDDLNGGEPANG